MTQSKQMVPLKEKRTILAGKKTFRVENFCGRKKDHQNLNQNKLEQKPGAVCGFNLNLR